MGLVDEGPDVLPVTLIGSGCGMIWAVCSGSTLVVAGVTVAPAVLVGVGALCILGGLAKAYDQYNNGNNDPEYMRVNESETNNDTSQTSGQGVP